jgi:hypothetical protein
MGRFVLCLETRTLVSAAFPRFRIPEHGKKRTPKPPMVNTISYAAHRQTTSDLDKQSVAVDSCQLIQVDNRQHDMLTLGEAAKVSTVTKSAISKAIKNGRMSALKDDKGHYQIDPAELYRVFPVNIGNSQVSVESVQQETYKETSGLHATVEHLREILAEIKSERDDLRHRLDKESEERRDAQTKLTALLTHQPEPKADTPSALPEARTAVRPAIWLALAAALIAAAATWPL